MKFVYPVLLVVAGAVLGWIALREGESDYRAPVAEVPATLAGEPGDGQVVRAFEVEGMCCRSCSQKLYASLVAVKGVAEAAVSFDSGRAQVVVSEGVPVSELEHALTFDDYTARLVP